MLTCLSALCAVSDVYVTPDRLAAMPLWESTRTSERGGPAVSMRVKAAGVLVSEAHPRWRDLPTIVALIKATQTKQGSPHGMYVAPEVGCVALWQHLTAPASCGGARRAQAQGRHDVVWVPQPVAWACQNNHNGWWSEGVGLRPAGHAHLVRVWDRRVCWSWLRA